VLSEDGFPGKKTCFPWCEKPEGPVLSL
jgi:hypothetical protein